LAGFDPLSDSRTALRIITIYMEKRFFTIVAALFVFLFVFFQDAKSYIGMRHYQARKWASKYRHMACPPNGSDRGLARSNLIRYTLDAH
jgi:hypothetical protein